MACFILGISAYYHDSAAVILKDGEILAAAQEERFTRQKHDAAFPAKAAAWVLHEAGIGLDRVSAVAFYDKPYLKFERLLETYHAFAPRGLVSFWSAMPVWIKEKLFLRSLIRKELAQIDAGGLPPILFPEHHLSHAASAFYPSPFEQAAILTLDGVGEWATTTIGHGRGTDITVLRQLDFPHSLGLLYSAFTQYCGFKVNSGEYKLMGLAPYGQANSQFTQKCREVIREEMVDLRADGSFVLNMDYFNYATGLSMCNDKLWQKRFGIGRRAPEAQLTQPYMDMALAIQQATEEIVLKIARTAKELTGCPNLVMAGGVALNCVANGKLHQNGIFDNLWIQPAAGDAGGALGAALAAWHIHQKQPRTPVRPDAMQGAYLGPAFGSDHVLRLIRKYDAVGERIDDPDVLCDRVAEILNDGKVVGWFQGRMEYGPRALGNRSIIGDARHPEMQKRMNLKIKYREGFRPFAPSVLAEDLAAYFELNAPSPYMLLVAPIKADRRCALSTDSSTLGLYERLYHQRSDIPAVTHVDYSARIQSVHPETNPRYWQLIQAFKRKTGYGLVVNTSFNVRGEPIVCTPEDAYRCFMRTEMDYLAAGKFLFDKAAQPHFAEQSRWQETFTLD